MRPWMLLSALTAAETARAGDLHLDAGIGTDFPVSVGAYSSFEGPFRLRARVGVGWLPGPYLDTINALSVSFGWYDDATAALIEAALKNSVIVHPEIGWRPFKKAGFHFEGGYQLAALGGSLSTVELIEAVTGSDIETDEEEAKIEVLAKASDHMLTFNLGYQIVIAKRIVIDTGLAGAFSAAATADLSMAEVEEQGGGRFQQAASVALEPLLEEGETFLVDTLTTYVHTGMVRVTVGYRFF